MADELDDSHVCTDRRKYLASIGGQLWPAATRCLEFLAGMAPSLGLDRPDVRVLELGAGLGYLGLSLARNLPHAHIVCLTEQATGGGLEWLCHNVSTNKQLPNMSRVTACECDWTDFAPGSGALQEARSVTATVQPSHLPPATGLNSRLEQAQEQQEHAPHAGLPATALQGDNGEDGPNVQPSGQWQEAAAGSGSKTVDAGDGQQKLAGGSKIADLAYLLQTPWDFIIGSDLIYNHIGSQLLPRVIQALSQPHTVTIYCHTKHRFDHLDLELMEHVAACGLSCEEVREPWMDAPPPSPPPLTELFPELRIAVYKLQLQQ